MLDDNDPAERQLGIDMGNQMLELCQELWLCGDRVSPGMEGERKTAIGYLGTSNQHTGCFVRGVFSHRRDGDGNEITLTMGSLFDGNGGFPLAEA